MHQKNESYFQIQLVSQCLFIGELRSMMLKVTNEQCLLDSIILLCYYGVPPLLISCVFLGG